MIPVEDALPLPENFKFDTELDLREIKFSKNVA